MAEQERRDLALKMVTLLPRYGSWAVNIRDVVTPWGKLGFRQLAILWALRHETIPPDELSPTTLARFHRVRPSVVTRALTRLEESGLIEREMDRHDRRRINITLTEAGRAASELVESFYLDQIIDSMGHLDDKEVEEIVRAVAHLEDIIGRLETAGHGAFSAESDEEPVLPGHD